MELNLCIQSWVLEGEFRQKCRESIDETEMRKRGSQWVFLTGWVRDTECLNWGERGI